MGRTMLADDRWIGYKGMVVRQTGDPVPALTLDAWL
ncbi:MAG: hypothetical protein RLY86_1691 [Pseudomonadota bacterium]|jgi:hypothetical protein